MVKCLYNNVQDLEFAYLFDKDEKSIIILLFDFPNKVCSTIYKKKNLTALLSYQ